MIFLILERNSTLPSVFRTWAEEPGWQYKTEKLLFHRDMAMPEDSKSITQFLLSVSLSRETEKSIVRITNQKMSIRLSAHPRRSAKATTEKALENLNEGFRKHKIVSLKRQVS